MDLRCAPARSGRSCRGPAAPAASEANAAPPRPTRNRASQASPLVVGNVLYLGTPYNHVVALDADTGSKIWDYEGDAAPSTRGIAYWAGDKQLAPQVVVGTMNGWLYTLNAKTGKLNPGFGNEGKVNLKVGVSDNFPRGRYGMSSPPAIYKDLIFSGAQLQEEPADGPSGDIRAWDIHSGKLVWTFHTIPRPGERNHEVWQEDQWEDRSGANPWGFMTVDEAWDVVCRLGTPTPDFTVAAVKDPTSTDRRSWRWTPPPESSSGISKPRITTIGIMTDCRSVLIDDVRTARSPRRRAKDQGGLPVHLQPCHRQADIRGGGAAGRSRITRIPARELAYAAISSQAAAARSN